ncbi:MAG: hypothetical protein R3B70_25740 [Polyangiaceae bacterium]
MRNKALLFASAVVVSALSMGCASYVPFTYEMRMEHRLTNDEVQNLQFYSSHEIKLHREVESQDRQVTPGHKLRLLSGKSVEEVVIPAKTPGVATRVWPDRIHVSFVSGTTLEFTARAGAYPLGMMENCDFVEPFAVAEGSARSKPLPSPMFLGQYAEPPNNGSRPVKVVGGGSRPAPVSDLVSGKYYLAVSPGSTVSFAGLPWDAIDNTSQAHLMIDSDKLEETEEKRTVLPGVRLDN